MVFLRRSLCLRRVKALAISLPCWGPPTWNSGMNGIKNGTLDRTEGVVLLQFLNSKKPVRFQQTQNQGLGQL